MIKQSYFTYIIYSQEIKSAQQGDIHISISIEAQQLRIWNCVSIEGLIYKENWVYIHMEYHSCL